MQKNFLTTVLFSCLLCLLSVYNCKAAAVISAPAAGDACLSSDSVAISWSNSDPDVKKYELLVYQSKSLDLPFELYIQEDFDSTVTSAVYPMMPSCIYECCVVTHYIDSTGKAADTSEIRAFGTNLPSDLTVDFSDFASGGVFYSTDNYTDSTSTVYGNYNYRWDYSPVDTAVGDMYLIMTFYNTESGDSIKAASILSEKEDNIYLECDVEYLLKMELQPLSELCPAIEMTADSVDSIKVIIRQSVEIPEFAETSLPDSSTCVPVNTELSWSPITGDSVAYYVEISKSKEFNEITQIIYSETTETGEFIGENQTTYYWRIYAVDYLKDSRSDYSAVRSFTTMIAEPGLYAPDNNATGLEIFENDACLRDKTVKLVFTNSNDTTFEYSYRVQAATTPDFSDTTMLVDINTPYKYYYLSVDTLFNTTVFWRVRINQAGDTLCPSQWSKIGQFVTPYSGPVVVSSDSMYCVSPSETVLEWLDNQESKDYILQISITNEFVASVTTTVKLSDTTFNLAAIESDLKPAKVYYWRVKYADSSIDSYYSKLCIFKTKIAPPELLTPQDAATGLTDVINLTWSATEKAKYNLQISHDENFNEILLDTVLTEAKYDLEDFQGDAVYFWRVSTIITETNGEDCASDFATRFKFITHPELLPQTVLLAPKNNTELDNTTVNLAWESVEGAAYYELQIATDTTFTRLTEHLVKLIDTTFTKYSLKEVQTYYWRVRATTDRTVGIWSRCFKFTTGLEVPTVPRLREPAAFVRVPVKPTFIWDKSMYANSYILEYANDHEFTQNLVTIHNIKDTTYTLDEALDNYTMYYWRVRAINDTTIDNTSYSTSSEWSEPWNFRTIKAVPDGIVELVSPENNSTGLKWDRIFLKWNPLENVEYYRVQVSESRDFDEFVIHASKVYQSEYSTLSYLDTNKTYYWRVLGENEAGATDWSDIWCFSTSELLSIYNANLFEGLELSPNPACINVNIKFNALRNMKAELHIVNAEGIETAVINGNYSEGINNVNINVSAFNSGSYICYIVSEGKLIAATQFVVAK